MTKRGSFLVGFFSALALHAVIVVVALMVFKPFDAPRDVDEPAAAVGQAASQAAALPDDLPVAMPAIEAKTAEGVTDADLQSAMTSYTKQAESMTADEQEALLNRLLPIAQKVDAQQVQNIAQRIEGLYGVAGDRAYEPREGVEGPVDIDSIVPYSAKKIAQPDGGYVYRQVWVDKAGRTMIREVKSADATLSDHLLHQSGQDATLGQLVQSAMRIADHISQQQSNATGNSAAE